MTVSGNAACARLERFAPPRLLDTLPHTLVMRWPIYGKGIRF